MNVKNKQLYSNECGKCSILNLLYFYNVKEEKLDINFSKEGTSISQMKEVLSKYFFDVDVVNFDIDQLKKVKNFKPFIALLKKGDISHYIVIYKKTNKYLYIMDSMYKKTYKVTYENFKEYESICYIVVDNCKKKDLRFYLLKKVMIMIFISLIESILMLSTTILLQQIIDNGLNDALLYIFVTGLLLIITSLKFIGFLNMFKKLDEDVVLHSMTCIYNLNYKYVRTYNIDEIYYRINDAYYLKNMIMSFLFDIINEIVLAITTIVLMFIYSISLSIIILFICFMLFILGIKVFNDSKDYVEKRRIHEYRFMNYYRDSFKDVNKTYDGNRQEEKISAELLQNFQKADYNYEKLQMKKDLILLYFQSFLICFIIVFYFAILHEYISVGSLIAIINLVTLVLQPILNICSKLPLFSNIKLIINRLKDINDNIK